MSKATSKPSLTQKAKLRNSQEIELTACQRLYVIYRARLGHKASEKEVAETAGFAAEEISRWKQDKNRWEFIQEGIRVLSIPVSQALILEGLTRIKDFRYWKTMWESYHGKITPDVDPSGGWDGFPFIEDKSDHEVK